MSACVANHAIGKFRPNSDLMTEFQTETLPGTDLSSWKTKFALWCFLEKFFLSGSTAAVNADTLLLHVNDAGERLSALVPVWRESTKEGVKKSEMRRKGGGSREKFGKDAFPGLDPCNPLIYHKTAKAFFGNPCRKQAEIWKSLEKKLGDRLYFAASAPSIFPRLHQSPADVRGARARLG